MIRQLLAAAAIVLVSLGAYAQAPEAGAPALPPEEAKQLRQTLEEPVPNGAPHAALRRHFDAKYAAAVRLWDLDAQQKLLKEAIALLPDAYLRNNLGNAYLTMGRPQDAIPWFEEALKLDPNYLIAMTNLAEALRLGLGSNRSEEVRVWLSRAKALNEQRQAQNRNLAAQAGQQRLFSRISRQQAAIEFDAGRLDKSLALAAESLEFAKKAAELSGSSTPADQQLIYSTVVSSLLGYQSKLVSTGRFAEAEATMADFLRFAQGRAFPARTMPTVYSAISLLGRARKNFQQAEIYALKAEAAWKELGFAESDFNRINASRDLLDTLILQQRFAQAAELLKRLDLLAGDSEELKSRMRFPYLRAELHLGLNDYPGAATHLRPLAQADAQRFGAHNFVAARSAGLLGVALWRTGSDASRKEALPLLTGAVTAYMAPENAEHMLDIFARNRQRDLIFSTFLEAVSQQSSADANFALIAADWVRSSSVQEALNDAATRAAASTPAMADLVRQDTDSRNEIRALRSYLSGEQYESRFLPAVEAQMRARIGELEKQRVALHQRIKASFPEYEQLVRPTPSGVDAIAGQLKTGQALLMLLPTDDAVYAWVAAAPATVQFIRVPMTLQRVAELVRRLRDTLDFGATGGDLRTFDIDASAELYRALLKPLEGMLRDKTELVVTAAGPLAQLPFGVLATSPNAPAAATPDWLIQRSAITHVPSIASWLAARRFARTRQAGEAMMGWADPLFDRSAAPASSPGAARSVKLARTRSDFDFSHPVVRSALDYSSIPPLPDTRDELVSIARRLNADPLADLKFGEHATKDSVLAASKSGALARKRVVAFATHGLMARDLPALSEPALALAHTASKDPLASLLTLEDVLNLKLNADWVVLSACNTAAADGKAEEALSGLARGFFYAGTRSLLVTHWAVETDSAKQLTTGTFAYYADHPEASKAESLRQAMLALMQQRDFAHPAYWAPYALVGDGSR